MGCQAVNICPQVGKIRFVSRLNIDEIHFNVSPKRRFDRPVRDKIDLTPQQGLEALRQRHKPQTNTGRNFNKNVCIAALGLVTACP